ncbi:MAG: peptide-methionine (S)-S-oxide reductase MsrA [Luteibaculaceae bacterium]
MNENYKIATFGGGCFWCTEAIFEALVGVVSVESGYAGGHVKNPTYEQVCSGSTGHAEVIKITYNPEEISYTELLEVFFKTHDPTTLNRQGADVGTQYRSVVFHHDAEQERLAKEIKRELNEAGIFSNPIVTEITSIFNYFPAEKYHQDYYNNNPDKGYCAMVITPKIEKFKKVFADKLKENQ